MLSFGCSDFTSILCRSAFGVNLWRRQSCESMPRSRYTYRAMLCYNSRYFQSIA